MTGGKPALPEDHRALLEAAIRAVSADNGQPWRFRSKAEGIELWIDEARAGGVADTGGMGTRLSCGAVLENMVVAAAARGLAADVRPGGTAAPPGFVAEVRLKRAETDPAASRLLPAIAERHTHRGRYDRSRPVDPAALERIAAAAAAFPGRRVLWFNDPGPRREAIRIVAAGERLRFTDRPSHAELYRTLRWGADADARRDGLAWDTLCLDPVARAMLRLLGAWTLTRALNLVGLHWLMAFLGGTVLLWSAPAIGALVAEDGDDLVSGRAFERLWLEATAAGLALQPLGSIPIFLRRLELLGDASFPRGLAGRVRALEGAWRALAGDPAGRLRPVLLFRAGHASPVAARSRRRELETFLMPEA